LSSRSFENTAYVVAPLADDPVIAVLAKEVIVIVAAFENVIAAGTAVKNWDRFILITE